MRDILRFLGPAGIVLVLFGLIPYSLSGVFDLWTAIHLVGGGTLLASGILLNFTRFRQTVASRGTRERFQALAGALLFGGILVTANVLAMRHPWRYDATENRIHTLSDKTRAVAGGLREPVELLAFFATGEPERQPASELLDRYSALNSRLSWRFVDPVREPEVAIPLDVKRQGVVVARLGETVAQTAADPTLGVTEGMITNLLLKVTRPGPKVIYMMTGHGEPAGGDLENPDGLGAFSRALEDDTFLVRPLLLSAAPKVPDDAALVIAAGPTKPLVAHELEQLGAYLMGGGRLLLLLDPATDPGLDGLLSEYGVATSDDMIVDQEQVPVFGPRLGLAPIIENFPAHAMTRNFRERILLVQARSVRPLPTGGPDGAEVRIVARTRPESWAERDYDAMLRTAIVSEDVEDATGPVPVAVAVTLRRAKTEGPENGSEGEGEGHASHEGGTETRLLVIGDSDWVKNTHLGAYFNYEFALNGVQWLVGHEELVAEGPRSLRPSRLNMTQSHYRNIFRLSVLLFPESLIILGLSVWWWRRTL